MACQACRQRKVEDSGDAPCRQCSRLDLLCEYAARPPNSRSRKWITRGEIIDTLTASQIKQSFEQAMETINTASPPWMLQRDEVANQDMEPMHNAAFMDKIYQDHTEHVLPVIPIISAAEFRNAAQEMSLVTDSQALVVVLTVITLHMTPGVSDGSQQHQMRVTALFVRALRIHGPMLPGHEIDVGIGLLSVVRGNHQTADATHCPICGSLISEPRTLSRMERLHWLLFIHERFFSFSQYRPVVLTVPSSLPLHDPSWAENIQNRFVQSILLFRGVDHEFIEYWRNRQEPSMTLDWVRSKQAELGENIELGGASITSLTAMQQIDLIVTCYWLRVLVWQMAMSRLLLKSEEEFEHEFISVVFPMSLSYRLQSYLESTPLQAVEVHGTGILRKIFDITITLADVLEYVVGVTDHYEDRNHSLDHFLFFYNYLIDMSNFYRVERSVLKDRKAKLLELSPSTDMPSRGNRF